MTNDEKILQATIAGVMRRVEELGVEEEFVQAVRERIAQEIAQDEIERIAERAH